MRKSLILALLLAAASTALVNAQGYDTPPPGARAAPGPHVQLEQLRADLGRRRTELATLKARPGPTLRPWELGRPPESKVVTCVAEGVWSNNAAGRGSSTWTIKTDGKATESDMGGATGQASMSGDTLTITWRTGAVAGVYTIDVFSDCPGGDGTLTFSDGPPGFDRTPGAAEFTRVSGPTGPEPKF